MMNKLLNSTLSFLGQLTVTEVALFSIFITFVIYLLGKSYELKMKKHESKKINYEKYIDLNLKLIKKIRDKDSINDNDIQKDFFALGSGLLMYGSKKVYRKYLFYREIMNNPMAENSKYFDKSTIIYLMGELLIQIRKELALEKFDNISATESLGFFVNGLTNNPIAKVKEAKEIHKIRMLKLEMFLSDRIYFVTLKRLFYLLLLPIFSAIRLTFKYFFMIPLGKIIIKLFPKLQEEKIETKK